MNWAPEDLTRLAAIAAETHFGHGDGGRQVNLQTQHETAEWRAPGLRLRKPPCGA